MHDTRAGLFRNGLLNDYWTMYCCRKFTENYALLYKDSDYSDHISVFTKNINLMWRPRIYKSSYAEKCYKNKSVRSRACIKNSIFFNKF